jgi:peptidyl-prolyl cis-trans isomerase D
MAVLSKIRQRSFILLSVLGLCLAAFVLGELFQSNLFSNSSNNVGSINGSDINFEDFRTKVANVEKSGQGISGTQAVNRVWDQEVSIALISSEFEKLGIDASEKQIIEILKQSQDIGENPQFKNLAGQFDIEKFRTFFQSNPQLSQQLKEREKDAALNAKFQVYSTLVKAGVVATNIEAKLKYEMESNKVNFDYVVLPYSSIKDSDVKVTDEEIKEYIAKNEKKYKAEANREIEYVVIEDKASKQDEDEVKNAVNASLNGQIRFNEKTGKNDTLPSFSASKNVAEFVNSNSDIPYDSSYVAKSDLPTEHADKLYNLSAGSIYGPYVFNGYYAVSKALGRQGGAKAKASHILLSYKGAMRANPSVTRSKDEAQAKAQEILASVTANPNSFLMQAFTNSDDSSKQQGGDLGYFSRGQMTPKFNDFVFNNPIGKIGLVETEFGFHVISVTDKQDGVRLATIARKIAPSEATTDANYTKAQKLEMEANEKTLAEAAKSQKLIVKPTAKVEAMDESVPEVGTQRQIVKWAFDSKTNIGDVKRFEVANVGNVVVKLKSKNEAGVKSGKDARNLVEPILKKNKKVALIAAKMKGASLEAIAKANAVTVQAATDSTIENPTLGTAGYEPKVVGTAFTTGNKLSGTIEGSTGVFVVKTKTVIKAPALKAFPDQLTKLKSQNANAGGRVLGALKEDAKIEDNRSMFY